MLCIEENGPGTCEQNRKSSIKLINQAAWSFTAVLAICQWPVAIHWNHRNIIDDMSAAWPDIIVTATTEHLTYKAEKWLRMSSRAWNNSQFSICWRRRKSLWNEMTNKEIGTKEYTYHEIIWKKADSIVRWRYIHQDRNEKQGGGERLGN